ncbi:hypothetical protein ACQCVB_11015 [Fictibacillus phosphorivorans]
MLKQYNFIIENILIEVRAETVEQGRFLAEQTLKEIKQISSKN